MSSSNFTLIGSSTRIGVGGSGTVSAEPPLRFIHPYRGGSSEPVWAVVVEAVHPPYGGGRADELSLSCWWAVHPPYGGGSTMINNHTI